MEIHEVKVSKLIPYENNPRRNDDAVEPVANSIREFGFKVPIIIDRNNVIVAGHTRLKAALKLGLETVPVIVADDLTDEQVRAFRLADNKVGEIATWDYELLDSEIANLTTDMSEYGFLSASDIDIDAFFEDAPPPDKGTGSPHEVTCPNCGEVFSV